MTRGGGGKGGGEEGEEGRRSMRGCTSPPALHVHASANVIGSSISHTEKQSILMSPKNVATPFPFGVWSGNELLTTTGCGRGI